MAQPHEKQDGSSKEAILLGSDAGLSLGKGPAAASISPSSLRLPSLDDTGRDGQHQAASDPTLTNVSFKYVERNGAGRRVEREGGRGTDSEEEKERKSHSNASSPRVSHMSHSQAQTSRQRPSHRKATNGGGGIRRVHSSSLEVLLSLGIRCFFSLSLVNLLLIALVLLVRLLAHQPCVPSALEQATMTGSSGLSTPAGVAVRLAASSSGVAQLDISPGQQSSKASSPGDFHQNLAYLEQMKRVMQRNMYRRSFTMARRPFPRNDALLPTMPCPQKVRAGGVRPESFYWLCYPAQTLKAWPTAYGLGASDQAVAFEQELSDRYGVRSVLHDVALPEGHNASAAEFLETWGGMGADNDLAHTLLGVNSELVQKNKAGGGTAYRGGGVLKVACYACDSSFLLPLLHQPPLSSAASYPSVGQIVLRMDRWVPPFLDASLDVLRVLEGAGYHTFHAEQLFHWNGNWSFQVSLVHQAILFPDLLLKDHSWKMFP